MSLESFIPQLWADTLLAALRQDLVFGNLINRDYAGTISRVGDTVRINSIGDVTISSYTKDTDLAAAQVLTDAQSVLVIDQAKYYHFEIDDVDAAQQQPKVMQEAMSWAAYQLALTIDQFIAGKYTEAASANLVGSSGSPVTVTTPIYSNVGAGTTVYDEITSLSQFLTQSKVPRQGRFCVIPPWCKTHLSQDPRFVSFNTAPARAALAGYGFDASGSQSSGSNDSGAGGPASDAYLGKIDGMDVYESLSAPHIGGTSGASGSQDAVIAGHPMAWTYADGVVKSEAYRPPLRFADAVKGLHLYGAKVLRPYALAVAYLQKP
jgi:hypothetical protein